LVSPNVLITRRTSIIVVTSSPARCCKNRNAVSYLTPVDTSGWLDIHSFFHSRSSAQSTLYSVFSTPRRACMVLLSCSDRCTRASRKTAFLRRGVGVEELNKTGGGREHGRECEIAAAAARSRRGRRTARGHVREP